MRWPLTFVVYFWLALDCSQASFPFSFWNNSNGNQVLPVTFSTSGSGPVIVTLRTLNPGAHIFYRYHDDSPIDPTHAGDTAGAGTIRIGTNVGTVNVSDNGHVRYIRALGYIDGMTDSVITEWVFTP